MIELIFVIAVIAWVVKRTKTQTQEKDRSNTTYVNGKPVKSQARAYSSADRTRRTKVWQAPKGDILSRAKENVRENETDILKQADAIQHQRARGALDEETIKSTSKAAMDLARQVGGQIDSLSWNDCDIMQHINDLMIMGYSGNLEFERDFISEGMDMLNRSSPKIG